MIVESEARIRWKMGTGMKMLLAIAAIYLAALGLACIGWAGHKNEIEPVLTALLVIGAVSMVLVLVGVAMVVNGLGGTNPVPVSLIETEPVEGDTE